MFWNSSIVYGKLPSALDLTHEEFRLYLPPACYPFPDWFKQKPRKSSANQTGGIISLGLHVMMCVHIKQVKTESIASAQDSALRCHVTRVASNGSEGCNKFWKVEPEGMTAAPEV